MGDNPGRRTRSLSRPSRGDVYWVDFEPMQGHEQGGHRPALVISDDGFNRSGAELLIVLPLTTRERGLSTHVRIDAPEGGVRQTSFIKSSEPRTISLDRVGAKLGSLDPLTLQHVEDILRMVLGL